MSDKDGGQQGLLELLPRAARGPRRDGAFALWLTLRVAEDLLLQPPLAERASRRRLQALEHRLSSLTLPPPLRRALGAALGGLRGEGAAGVPLVLASLVLIYLWATAFGSRHRYDVILNLHWERPLPELGEVENLLHRHARRSHCASQRASEHYPGTDLSFWLLLRDPERVEEMLSEVRSVNGVSRVTSLQAEEESEV